MNALAFPKRTKHGHVDKAALAHPEVTRTRDPAYLAWLHTLPCSVPGCTRGPIHAHHITCSPEPKARGAKASDLWCLPVCHTHHQGPQSIHETGAEQEWWSSKGIDPIALCEALWAEWHATKGRPV